jgi:hypothetical protein
MTMMTMMITQTMFITIIKTSTKMMPVMTTTQATHMNLTHRHLILLVLRAIWRAIAGTTED